jgi:site-specific DNA recombinase
VQRAVVYVRVSSVAQEEHGTSLETQEAACRTYCAERGYQLLGVYSDVHTGGQYRERPGLSALRELVRSRGVDVVLAYAIDRLSRHQSHLAILAEEAADHGARLEFVTESFEDSAVGRFIRNARAFAGEVEREKIAERTVRGRLARVQAGKLIPGGKPPYGYRWRDNTKGALDLDPATAPVIRSIFEHIAGGGTLRSAVQDLRTRSIPTPTGRGTWHAQTIRDMLLKPLYCGRAYAWGWKKRTPGNPQQFDPDKAIPLPPGTIPAIVSEETWAATQARMTINRQRATRSAKNPEAALLRGGYAVCGLCGRTVNARPRRDGNVDYLCKSGRRNGDCPGCTIFGRRLDTAVWSRVSAILTDPSVVAREVVRLRASDPTADDLAAVDRALAEIERQQSNAARSIALLDDAEAAAPLVAQLRMLQQRRASLVSERDDICDRRAAWQSQQIAVDRLEDWCRNVATGIERMTWAEKRLAMDALGVRVTVYPHGHEPRYVITADIPIEIVSSTT